MDRRRLETLDLNDLLPEPADDRPAVDWGAEPAPANLWEIHPTLIANEAVRVIRDAREVEAETTGDFLESLPEGVKPHALQFRMKSPSSLARKLRAKSRQNRQDYSANKLRSISDKLTDVLRYTALTTKHDELIGAVQATAENLLARGYSVTSAEHSYVEGNAYKGIHLLVAKSETARKVEIQFHSELSQSTKDENHPDYEIERAAESYGYEARAAAFGRMIERSSAIPKPPGLAAFTKVGGCDVETKRYPNRFAESDNGTTGGSTP